MDDKDPSHRSAALRDARCKPSGREALERALAEANEALARKTRELAHSAALMQATMDATTNGILVMDEHRKVAGFNAKFGEMWKIPREILAAQDYRAVLAHASRRFDDPRAFLDGVEAIYATCPAETFDLLRLRDGRVIERHSKIQTVDGRYAGRVFSFRDITERVRAKERWTQSEAALRESEGFNRTIVESSNDCIKTLSLEGTLLWINDNGAAQLRIPDTAAVLGKSWFDTWHGEDRVAAEQGVAAAAAGGTGRFVGYYPINGEPHWFDVVITPIVDAAGKPARLLAVSRDVTDRRRSESALRENGERLQLALMAGRLGDWTWDAENDRVTFGARGAEMFAIAPTKSVPRRVLLALVHEDDRRRVRATIEQAIAARIDYDIEFRLARRVGPAVWIAARGRGIYAEDGAVKGMTGVVQDITERKLAEETLRESEARLTLAMEAAHMGSWEWDVRSGKISWSSTLEAMRGLPAGGFDGTFETYVRDIHPEDRSRVLATIEDAVAGKCEYRMEYRAIRPDGRLIWIEGRGKPYLDARGRPERVAGISMDITARKQAEEALLDETRVLELVNETGAALASNLDQATLVQNLTDAATRLTGARFGAFFYNVTDANGESYMLYTLSGAPREAFEKFGHPRPTPIFGPTFHGEGPVRIEDVLKDPRYGTMAPHYGMPPGHLPVRSYLAMPVISRSGDVIGGLIFGHPEPGIFTARAERIIIGIAAQAAVAFDNARLYEAAQKEIEERKRIEHDLKVAAEERKRLLESEQFARAAAERASAMKDEFLATLSHELRTPLSAILGWSQVLLRRVRDQPEFSQGLQTIERNARAQTQLIEDLLDMSRITSGKVRLDIQLVDPISFIEAALETVRPAAEAKGIRLESVLDPTAGPVSGDPGRLQQVVWNLLTNAVKFTARGGKIQVVLERVNSHVEISVADTGIGIRPQFLDHVFERFRQADASTTRTFGGLGLGLSIVRHLAELHGGSVKVASDGEGRGATFSVHLPISVVHRFVDPHFDRVHPKGPHDASPDYTHSDLSGLKILVVDDEPDARELIRRVLSECNATVCMAASAAEALRLHERERPDVLVSDIGMPEADGYELLRRMREAEPGEKRIPAIALTAYARSEDRTRALRAGFLVHVSKPVEPAELVATVASVAGRANRENVEC